MRAAAKKLRFYISHIRGAEIVLQIKDTLRDSEREIERDRERERDRKRESDRERESV